MEMIQAALKRETFEKLQQIAEPLVDDINSVIERLLNHWESKLPYTEVATNPPISSVPSIWVSTRGEKFFVGTKLRATYNSYTFYANVSSDGIEFENGLYDNPSAAGIAAKKSVGILGTAVNTNGWSFWEMQVPDSSRWVSINTVRYAKKE